MLVKKREVIFSSTDANVFNVVKLFTVKKKLPKSLNSFTWLQLF